MVTVKEPLSDFIDLGPVIYQESKILDNEIHLLCVHDNREKKFVNFEAYSFETGKITRIQWDYMNFDSHFRFNAELMNPNNREGRYHWVCERLAFVSDGKGGRKLALAEPTDDLPQVADRSRNFKIPTGRMNYSDRQRLRQEMQRLPHKRDESIIKLETTFKERFIKELLEAKDLEKKKLQMRLERIAHERMVRYQDICEAKRQESILTCEYADKERKRESHLKEKADVRKKAALAEIKEILARHDQERKEQQDKIMAARAAKQAERARLQQELNEKIDADINAESRRMDNWEARDERLEHKAIRLLATRTEWIQGEERKDQARGERQKEFAHQMNTIRANLWAIHREREQKRKSDQQASIEAVAEAKERAREAALAGLQKPPKKKEKKLDGDGGEKIDAVEYRMREQMEKEDNQKQQAEKRQRREQAKEEARAQREVRKVETWKQEKLEAEDSRATILEEKLDAHAIAEKAARMDAMRDRDMKKRKTQQREHAGQRRLKERTRKLCPKFKAKRNEFLPC